MTDKKHLIKCNQSMARSKNYPRYFVGIIQIETAKAYKIVGSGISLKKKMGICSICGRELSDPNSIKLGIGPICAEKMGINTLEGYTDKDIEKEMLKIKIDSWFPKSCIDLIDADDLDIPEIEVPELPKKETEEKRVEIDKNTLKIFFPYNADMLTKVKTLSGRRYSKDPKPHWICPNTEQNIIKLKNFGFDVPEIKKIETKIEIPELPVHLKNILFPYQKEGVNFLFEKNGRAIIGDEMGLGKTIQALTYIEMDKDIKSALVVCPASLKLNWASEAKKWMQNINLWVCSGKKINIDKMLVRKSETAKKNIYIINYDVLSAWIPFFENGMDIMVTDECHFFKNTKAIRTKAVKKLSKKIDKFVALSGTPIINRPSEFFNALNIVDGNLFGSFWNYAKQYCGATNNGYGWDFSGSSNTQELNEIIQSVMIRRKKDEVLKELPPKIRTIIPIEITNRSKYNKAEKNLIAFLQETEGLGEAKKAEQAETLVKIEKLKQLCWDGKKKAAIEWVKDYLQTEDKLVLFAKHTSVLDFFEKEFKNECVRIDGSVSMINRDKAVNDFQNDSSIKLFLGNMQAAGVGLTLTAANATCFMEFDWTPGAHDQAEDRVHRIGQEADSVHAFYLTGTNTIDETIMTMLDSKRGVLDSVLDGKEDVSFSLIEMLKAA